MSLKNPVTPPGIDPGTVRLVAQRLNHYATPGPCLSYIWIHKYKSIHLVSLFVTDALDLVCGSNSVGQTCLLSIGSMLAMKITIL
jgi:hypothetical protein